jgi:hypothetical protein
VRLRLRDLSIRAKVLVTGLGALLVVLGLGTLLSFRYWEREQLALTVEHAAMAVRALRPSVEAGLAHGQRDWVRELLDTLVARPPAESYRIVAPNGVIMLSSVPGEEGSTRRGPPLPEPRDIPPEGLTLGGRATPGPILLVPLGGLGGRAILEVRVGFARVHDAVRRGRNYAIALTALLGLAYAAVLGVMLEREVVAPLRQMGTSLARARAGESGVRVGLKRGDELGGIGRSVDALLDEEEKVARLAETQSRRLVEQAGFAEVGALAAEIGHEIKRPLAGIHGAIELITQEYAMSDGERALLGRVQDQLRQVDQTLRDLLSLAKPVGLAAQPVDVAAVLDGALVRLAGTGGVERVSVKRDYEPELPVFWGDAGRLEQAFLNLLVNAVEAMPDGGRLTVRAQRSGDAIAVSVADTGVGIKPENLDRVLKPFFSTKPHGTGLGLPLVARVVAAHGGTFRMESEPGRGTVVRIRLPQSAAAGGGS